MSVHSNRSGHAGTLTPREAGDTILSRIAPLPAERVALRDAAGRVLRQDVKAERDNPPFDRVCMDGVALASDAILRGKRRLRVQATQAAGEAPLVLAAPDSAIEIMTGAVLPPGTDCVVPLEEYDLASGMLELHVGARIEPWRNVQRRGSDSAPGATMLTAGMRLGAPELAVVASAGLAEVLVGRQPRVTVISTGDELVEPGEPIAGHQVRRSNAHAIAGALRLHGCSEVRDRHLRDDEALMRASLGEVLATGDVLVLSGGVSKGKFDFVPPALKALGIAEVFHEVAQRPGHPMWFGTGPAGQLVFGLPGNPVAALMCLVRYVLPALRALMGQHPMAAERIASASALPGRAVTSFVPVAVGPAGSAASVAQVRPTRGSGDFLTLAGTDGFIELPPQPAGYPAGFVADLYRW